MRIRRIRKASLAFLKKLWPGRSSNRIHSSCELEGVATAKEQHTWTKTRDKSPPPAPSSPVVDERDPCPICHDPVGVPNPEGIIESWTKLHCGHEFGTECIQTWLDESCQRDPNKNPSCPICRTVAKHPCGHLVSPPPYAPMQHPHMVEVDSLTYQNSVTSGAGSYQSPRSPPASPTPSLRVPQVRYGYSANGYAPHRRPRRRLTRRAGHPQNRIWVLAPRRAQTVGKCAACEQIAAMEARAVRGRRQLNRADSVVSTASYESDAATAGSARNGAAGSSGISGGIKSRILPSLKRLSSTHRSFERAGAADNDRVHSFRYDGSDDNSSEEREDIAGPSWRAPLPPVLCGESSSTPRAMPTPRHSQVIRV
ncbi:Uu.00g086000.m01.CDS01 [Anthostomella pinea]|uniref:Uu.00g086000.m01.CDS01 n=1 Tax=Anthostomella pinea TaxID=933095 RepID=A0AAI8VM33_9PEZI|nr:Uu.00g086000.m01.CDS01 [Anthostomella pinea]